MSFKIKILLITFEKKISSSYVHTAMYFSLFDKTIEKKIVKRNKLEI